MIVESVGKKRDFVVASDGKIVVRSGGVNRIFEQSQCRILWPLGVTKFTRATTIEVLKGARPAKITRDFVEPATVYQDF